MKRYIAFFRGINISGKNKISMRELKDYLTEQGYSDIRTYLNSGNVIFSAQERSETTLSEEIQSVVESRFELQIPVLVILQETLKDILGKAPDWWGTDDKAIYDNLIFAMPGCNVETIAEKIGEPTKELEQVFLFENTIFWSFDRKRYAKANWWKRTASVGIGEMITIRNANTVKKITEM